MKKLLTLAILMNIPFFSARAESLATGSPAPVLTATDQDGQTVDFAKIYAAGPTLVYFYPKADTPGCTAQACSLRDSFTGLKKEGLTILGVSRDTPAAQKKFQEKYQLPFTLIADVDGKVSAAFGVGGIMGLPVSKRESFLIVDGKVVWNTPKGAKTKDHAAEVQAALDTLP